jgi:hypothetical protein
MDARCSWLWAGSNTRPHGPRWAAPVHEL